MSKLEVLGISLLELDYEINQETMKLMKDQRNTIITLLGQKNQAYK